MTWKERIPAGRLEYQKRFKARALPGEVEVTVEGGVGPQDVVLESAHGDCAATGRVLDVAGRPIPGATLHIDFDASGLRTYGEKKTSEAGQFEIAGLPPGTLKLQVDAPGFGTAHAETVLGEPGEVARLDVVLERASSLRARLEYADGEPDGDPRIALEMKTDGRWRHRTGGSPGAGIEGGVFTAERLPPGIYRISATFKEHAELLSPEIDLRDVESAEVVLRVEAGAAVAGRIALEDPEFGQGHVLAHLHYTDGVRAVKEVRIEGSRYRIEHLRRGRLADLVLQCEPEILSEPLQGFAIEGDENVVDLGPVRKRAVEK